MEAHESALRSLALTADGSKLATASVKGTVIRVWDVPSASCLREFRRGVERATVACLAFSWDATWLCCASDKGTAHVFRVGDNNDDAPTRGGTAPPPSLTRLILSSVRKSVEGDAHKSVYQIRGVPHPVACAFVSEAKNVVAVAGWDADGNGVLLLSELSTRPGDEPRRVGYHVLCRSAVTDVSDEARRRRRLRGWTPEIPPTPEGGRLYVGERLEILERGMEQIRFEEKDEFISVTALKPEEVVAAAAAAAAASGSKASPSSQQAAAGATATGPTPNDPVCTADESGHSEYESSQTTDEAGRSNLASTVGDSVRTEPLDDEFSDHPQ